MNNKQKLISEVQRLTKGKAGKVARMVSGGWRLWLCGTSGRVPVSASLPLPGAAGKGVCLVNSYWVNVLMGTAELYVFLPCS